MALNVLLLIIQITTARTIRSVRPFMSTSGTTWEIQNGFFVKFNIWFFYNRVSIYVNFVWHRTKITDIFRNNMVYVHTYVPINTLYTYILVVEMKYYFLYFVQWQWLMQQKFCYHSFVCKLTFWRRIIFQVLAHSVFKMWVIQKPNQVALWNKRHFEEEKMEIIQHV